MPGTGGFRGLEVTVPLRKPPKYEAMLPQIVEMAEAGSGIALISRALGIGAEVDRRRKAGEGFDRLAREMKVSRGTIVRAYDHANRDDAAAAAREGRQPTRPPYKWSEESRAARRKPHVPRA
jgi:hypothetical protein